MRSEVREPSGGFHRALAFNRDRQYVRHALQEARVVHAELVRAARVRAEYSERSGGSEYGDLDAAAHAQPQKGGIRESLVPRQIFGDERLAARPPPIPAAPPAG